MARAGRCSRRARSASARHRSIEPLCRSGRETGDIKHLARECGVDPKQITIGDSVPRTSEMVQSKYLKTADVPDPVIVTVTKVGRVNMAKEDAAPEYKWAIRFQEFDKPMV
jgi:hypothetical protein